MTEAQFRQFAAEGFNRIPLVLETFADLDTPLSVYLKLANRPWSYLLESVQGGERFGRYSFIGLPGRDPLRGARPGVQRVLGQPAGAAVASTPIRSSSCAPARRASGRPCPRGCRASAAGWSATSATTRCATSSRGSRKTSKPDDALGRAGHPAAAVRAARRGGQPLGQALSHRVSPILASPAPTRGRRPACTSSPRPCGVRWRCRRNGRARPANRSTEFAQSRIHRCGGASQALHPRRRHHAGRCCRSASAIPTRLRRCRCTAPCAR